MAEDIIRKRIEKLCDVLPAQSLNNLFGGAANAPRNVPVSQQTTLIADTRMATALNPSALRGPQGGNCD